MPETKALPTCPDTLAPATALAVVAKVARPAVATFKFATCVVLVTVNGAVPGAILDIKRLAVTIPAVFKLPEVVLPVTVKLVNVPTLVMFGCALVVNDPCIVE